MAIDQHEAGILAALAAPFCMAVGFIVWDNTWKNSSAFSLNLFKCNLASVIFLIAGFVFGFTLNEENFRFDHQVGWLVLSGIIGIIIGDLFWLEALRRLGAFQVLVIDTIKPFCAALLGRLILGENIQGVAYAGIVMTVAGVLIVSVEQDNKALQKIRDTENKQQAEKRAAITRQETLGTLNSSSAMLLVADQSNTEANKTEGCESKAQQENDDADEEEGQQTNPKDTPTDDENVVQEQNESSKWYRRKGLILAVANVVLDTYGSLLTKQHGANFTTWAINLIRFGSSGLAMLVISCCLSLFYCRKRQSTNSDDDPSTRKEEWYQLPHKPIKIWAQATLGVIFVTFFTPALSNYALFQIALALALTLTSISPLYALFLEWAFYGSERKPTLRALVGATLAAGGVVVLGIFNE
jgi:drug/metabolite transporter (DMT)-like permease